MSAGYHNSFGSIPFYSFACKNRMNVVAYEQNYKQIQIQRILVFQPFPPKCFQAVVSMGGNSVSLFRTIISMLMQPPQVTPSPADKPKLLKDEG